MKRISKLVNLPLSLGLALGAVAVTAAPALADDVDVSSFEYVDVIEKNDGSVLKGVIVEQEPGQKYKLALSDGSVFVINAAEVKRLTKERNKNWRGAYGAPPPPAPVQGLHGGVGNPGGGAAMGGGGYGSGGGMGVASSSGGSSLPPPLATSGTRIDGELAVLFPRSTFSDGDIIETSFAPTIRVGYEEMFGNFGVTGGGMGRFTYWMIEGDTGDAMWTLETMAFLRGSLHVGRAAPYAQVALGLDTNYIFLEQMDESFTDIGFGVNLGFGAQVALSKDFAIDIGADLHPGTDTTALQYRNANGETKDVSVSYFGLRLGIRTL